MKQLKNLQLVVKNKFKFLENIDNLQISNKIKNFLKSITIEDSLIKQSGTDYPNYIQLDSYKWNFYGFKEKPLLKPRKILFNNINNSFKQIEINTFDWSINYLNPSIGTYIKRVVRPKEYYDIINEKIPYLNIMKREDVNMIDYDPQSESIINYFKTDPDKCIQEIIGTIDFLGKNGLWLNAINTYSVRYSPKKGIIIHDPDAFYIIKENRELQNENLSDYLKVYTKYKAKPKELTYGLVHNSLDKEAAEYLYWNILLNEALSKKLVEMYPGVHDVY